MTKKTATVPLQFNALTDPWLPLTQDGGVVMASPAEVLCGEKDGVDLDYPRDDFRVYARLLLSALVQALFAAKTKAELERRLTTPMSRGEFDKAVKKVHGDFNLFGPTPFLQIVPPTPPPKKGAAPFVFGYHDIYQPAVPINAVSLPIALVTLFIEQTYAGGAGRGYGAGPGGQPGALTLIDPGSVRTAAWANTLILQRDGRAYAPDPDRPWSNQKIGPVPRAAVGLVSGLFFQPRGIWLEVAGHGRCSFTGMEGPLVRLSPFISKSTLAKKSGRDEDIWRHPCAPLAVNSQGIGAVRLRAEQPAWTGLAQLLQPLGRSGKQKHPLEGPAPVLTQWTQLAGRPKRPRLLVLDFDRDKANVKRRFFEAYPLTESVLDQSVLGWLRTMVTDAETVQAALVRNLKLAHDERKSGGLALADATSAFWGGSESHFLAWLDTIVAMDQNSAADHAAAGQAAKQMAAALRRTAMEIFDEHASLSEFDPRKQKRVAKARRRLTSTLWPKPKAEA